MSSDFLSPGPVADLIPLMVHPSDHERLRNLAGIWPVEDTLTRMIDVFIATGAARAATSLQTSAPPVPKPVLPVISSPEASLAKTDNAPVEPMPVAVSTPKPPAPPLPTARITPATPDDKGVLTFTRSDYPDLRFTGLDGFEFGGVSRSGPDLTWTGLFEEAIRQAIGAGHPVEALNRIGIRTRAGKRKDCGYRFCEKMGISYQISTSNYMFARVLRISDLLGVPVRVGYRWDTSPKAAHPGRSGLITGKPIRARAPKAQDPVEDVTPRVGARFPLLDTLVSYVYLDRKEEERVIQLVQGKADPEAGQVSIGSPLGQALIDTPVGGIATLELRGVNRKLRVLEVATV